MMAGGQDLIAMEHRRLAIGLLLALYVRGIACWWLGLLTEIERTEGNADRQWRWMRGQ